MGEYIENSCDLVVTLLIESSLFYLSLILNLILFLPVKLFPQRFSNYFAINDLLLIIFVFETSRKEMEGNYQTTRHGSPFLVVFVLTNLASC